MAYISQYDKQGNRAERVAEVYRGIAIREDADENYFVELFFSHYTFLTVYEARQFVDKLLG